MKLIHKKILVSVLGCILVGGVLFACSSQENEDTRQEVVESYEPVSVVYLNKAGYEDIIVGDKKGYFEEAAPEITLYTVSGSGQQSVEAMLAGSADIAATGQGPVADAIKEYGNDIIILAGSNCSTGSQVFIAGPHMTGETQLTAYNKEKDNVEEVKASFEAASAHLGDAVRIGVQQGATTEGELKSWLKAMDISFNDFSETGDGVVSLIDVKANTLPTVLASGSDIDVMAASQPYPNTALAQISGSYMLGSDADTNSYGVACLITTKAIYEEKEESIKAFLEADSKACDFMNSNVEEAIRICADSIGTDETSVKAAFDIADFKITLSDQMVESIFKACEKKDAGITKEQLIAQMPLKDWLDNNLNK